MESVVCLKIIRTLESKHTVTMGTNLRVYALIAARRSLKVNSAGVRRQTGLSEISLGAGIAGARQHARNPDIPAQLDVSGREQIQGGTHTALIRRYEFLTDF